MAEQGGGWLERWHEQEPARLWLWTVGTACIGASVVAGWLTTETSLALGGVLSALLMVGAGEKVRGIVWAPATVEAEQRAVASGVREAAYRKGRRDALEAIGEVSTDDGNEQEETRRYGRHAPATGPATAAFDSLPPCGWVDPDTQRQCRMRVHPAAVPHVTGAGAQE